MSEAPIEFTARYSTSVETLAEAWAFVMEYVDRVGPDPQIQIDPFWKIGVQEALDGEDREPPRHFGVVVSGMVKESDIA